MTKKKEGRERYASAEDLVECAGLSSRTKDGYHALFWDLDYPEELPHAQCLRAALEGLRHVQREHDLYTVYVFYAGTPRSWHAVCPQRFPMDRAASILREHPDHDPQHVRVGRKLGRWILRISPKADDEEYAWFSCCPSQAPRGGDWRVSMGHLRFMWRSLGAPRPVVPEEHRDEGGGVEVEYYRTPKTRPDSGESGGGDA